MTREKAIEQLQYCKGLIKQNGQVYLDERDFPLLDMAIEALQAEQEDEPQFYDEDDYWNGRVPTAQAKGGDADMNEVKSPYMQPSPNGADLISRADAINAFWEDSDIRTAEVRTTLKALPSADAETKYIAQIKVDTEEIVRRIKEEYDITDGWIPCSERLPKEKQEVYVTVYFIEGDTGRAYGYMDGFGRWHLYSTVEGTLNSGYEVTAWMPLPKPYREDGEE